MRPGRRALLRAAAWASSLGWLGWPVAGRAQGAGAVALLVGNTSYNPRDESLPPALKSIRDLEPRLRRFGFDVVTLHDPPVAQFQAELDKLQQAVAARPAAPAVFYFVGHGFQSNAENFLVPAGGDLSTAPAQLAKNCVSLEKEIFTKMKRSGPAATVILVDACRTPDRPRSPGEGYNQTMPPEGCHVAFATGPGKRAFAPNDPDRHTLFAEVLVSELETSPPDRSILLTLESVRAKVANRVNSIDAIVRAFGRNAQEPELASNVRGDPPWAPAASSTPAVGGDAGRGAPALPGAADVKAPDPTAAGRELEAVRGLASPEEAAARLKALLQGTAQGDDADIANLRLRDLEKVLAAARTARLNLDIAQLAAGQPPNVAEDMQKALRGDKYAAMRVAESLPRPRGTSELIERTEHGRWMIFASHLGNGIAAYRLSEHFRNVDRRDAEAARYLALARANNYTPPRQLDAGR